MDTKRQKLGSVTYDSGYTNNIHLNQDCLMHIFGFLPITDRVRVERVCKQWNKAAKAAWQNFQELNFCQENWGIFNGTINNFILKKLLRHCGRFLTHISAQESSIVKNVTLLPKYLPNLKYVNLDQFKVSVPLLRDLALYSKNIEKLSIHSPTKKCNDENFGSLFLSLKNLRCIRIESAIRQNKHINGLCLQYLNAECIEEIALPGCYYINFYEICYILKNFKKLHTLILRDMPIKVIDGESLINTLSVLKNLKVLDVSGNHVLLNDRFFIKLKDVGKSLISLNLGGCKSKELITDDSLKSIACLPRLQELSIIYLSSKVSVKMLYSMNNLKRLYLCWGEVFDSEALGLISALEKIEYLDLKKCNITKRFVQSVPKITQTHAVALTIGLQGTLVRVNDLPTTSPKLKFIL